MANQTQSQKLEQPGSPVQTPRTEPPYHLLVLPARTGGGVVHFSVQRVEEGSEEKTVKLGLPAEEAAAADKAVKELKAKLDAVLNDPAVKKGLEVEAGSEQFKRLMRSCKTELAEATPEKAAVLKATALPQSPRQTFQVLVPDDPNRPGLNITFANNDRQPVDEVVSELKDATTSVILWSGGFLEVKKTRANSTLVVKVDDSACSEMKAATEVSRRAREVLALKALTSIQKKLGQEANEGRFDEEVDAAKATVLMDSREFAKQIAELSGQQLKKQVCTMAAEFRQKGIDDELPIHLLGVEVDFENKRAVGIEYYVITNKGKTYSMPNIGRNFGDEKGPFVPAKPYAEFNVAVLRSYQKNGGIGRDELYKIAMANGFYPTEDGKISFLDPERYAKRFKEAKQQLAETYTKKKSLTAEDLATALSE